MTEEKIKEREGINQTPSPSSSPKDLALTALIIVLVLAIGLFSFNLFLEIKFKSVFLASPCDLCLELNPLLENCFNQELTVTTDPNTGEIINNKNNNFNIDPGFSYPN